MTGDYPILLLVLALAAGILSVVLLFLILAKLNRSNPGAETQKILDLLRQVEIESEKEVREARQELMNELRATRQELMQTTQSNIRSMAEILSESQKNSSEAQDMRLAELNRQIETMTSQNEKKLEGIRTTMEQKITSLQEDNSRQLDLMRNTVDEKLQKTLEERIGQSFKLVSDRLEQVYKGLGEMQTLANGVGDLKKVLSNVKTRGILGEIQLGAILDQILSKEQYEENITTKGSGSERVEFAIKLPGDEDGVVYLPIDAKFPGDSYAKLVDAYEGGRPEEIDEAVKGLEKALKKAAKDIHDKYIDPPHTTDFGIMFLPFEGLYAEAVRRGMVETLQREYKINIAGPTTMAALLNSLQMGFKTLAIQKHSSQVWDILGAVKTEFDKFGNVLAATQQRITQANAELDKLIGVRTRSIQRKLSNVVRIGESESTILLGLDAPEDSLPLLENEEE